MDIKIQNCKNNNTISNTKDWVEYTDKVRGALEKQVPKKVRETVGDYENSYYCDRCGQNLRYEHQKYCDDCGGKQSW